MLQRSDMDDASVGGWNLDRVPMTSPAWSRAVARCEGRVEAPAYFRQAFRRTGIADPRATRWNDRPGRNALRDPGRPHRGG